jgi:SAM-dependent methyltransferase
MTLVAHVFKYASPRGEIRYADGSDHFERGLLRLLSLDRAGFERWVALAEQASGSMLDRLREGFAKLRPIGGQAAGPGVSRGPYGLVGSVLHAAIAESPAFGVAVDEARSVGWLIDGGRTWVDVPPAYEEAYYEDPTRAAGGYGAYLAQAEWRLEKAARQIRQVGDATGVRGGKALDVGSGYGFFREALAQAGFEHQGVEISAHARRVAREIYGFETHSELDGLPSGTFDLVTLWDVLEHVPDPVALLARCRDVLRPGGVVALKTPNLDCPEAEVFGPHYHSLRREHLFYFTPRSVRDVAERAGLSVLDVQTVSHLLVGFVGEAQTAAWEREGRGADLVSYAKRPHLVT